MMKLSACKFLSDPVAAITGRAVGGRDCRPGGDALMIHKASGPAFGVG